MAAFSDIAENKLIDWFFRAQAIGLAGATAAAGTGPAHLYIGLLTGTAPTDSTAGTEVAGNNYSRYDVASALTAWAATQNTIPTGTSAVSSGTGGTTFNSGVITFPTPSATWGTVTAVGIYDSASGGSLLIYSTLTASKVINSGDAVTFPAGALTFQLDN